MILTVPLGTAYTDHLTRPNPPFIGQYTKTAEQTADMKAVWGADYDGYLDYVTGWHAQAMHYFADLPTGRFAFVTMSTTREY